MLAGGADNSLVAELKRHFTTVKHAKPPASRKDSSEWYVVAQGFKGGRNRIASGSNGDCLACAAEAKRRCFPVEARPGPGHGAADDDPSGIGTHSQIGAAVRLRPVLDLRPELPAAGGDLDCRRRDRASDRPRYRRATCAGITAAVCCGSPVTLLLVANVINLGADLSAMGDVYEDADRRKRCDSTRSPSAFICVVLEVFLELSDLFLDPQMGDAFALRLRRRCWWSRMSLGARR